MIFITPQQIKYLESVSDQNSLPCDLLTDNAASEVVQLINIIMNDIDVAEGIVILCGKGNNGADGFAIAKKLSDESVRSTVVLADGEPTSANAKSRYSAILDDENIDILKLDDDTEEAYIRFTSAAVFIDAVYGIGFRGKELPPSIRKCFNFIKRCSCIKIAVDIPSGGNALTGEVAERTLRADYTVTFGLKKIGMLMEPLKRKCGEIIIDDIGLDKSVINGVKYLAEDISEDTIGHCFPLRKENSHKGHFGRLLNVAGNRCMSGAAALSTLSALRSGTGLVRLASTETVVNRLAASIYEATYLPLSENKDGTISADGAEEILETAKSMTAISIGSGLGVSESTKYIVAELIKNADCPIILDADGINCLLDNIDIIKNTKNKLIITPHAAELARIHKASGIDCGEDRLTVAIELAKAYGIIVVAKGYPTFIVGDEKVYVCNAGNPGLSKGGSGDVLTGIIAGFAAQGIYPVDAAVAGVYVHGYAANMVAVKSSKIGMLPSDVIEELPFVFRKWNR